MRPARTLIAVIPAAALAVAVAACTPADNNAADADAADGADTTIIEREVPAAPVVVEREVAVPSPPVVIEREVPEKGDTTTIRAGENGLEVETTTR